MNKILAMMNQLNKTLEAAVVAGWSQKPPPLRCRCGRLFRGGMKTWLPHFNKEHPILVRKYRNAPGHDRVNLLLSMMRNAKAKSKES